MDINQKMGNIAISGQGQYQVPQLPQRPQLNQLYPIDLLNQAFNVAELDIPPPAIILPPNVRTEHELPA